MEGSSPSRTISWEDINVGEKVGEGATGYVHKAELISESRRIDVAVKRMCKDSILLPDPQEAKKFLLDEAQLMSKLHHPNIVSFIGLSFFTDDGIADFPAIVMEYLPSGTLVEDAVHRAFPLRTRVRMALQIAEAMQYIHSNEKNIVHNDLTSNNIFLDLSRSEEPVCKLGDFGAGQEGDKKSMVSKYEVDHVHGFGVVLHELLAGESNFIDPNNYVVGLRSAVLMGKELVADCWRKPPGEMLRRKLPDSDEVVERLHQILDAIPTD